MFSTTFHQISYHDHFQKQISKNIDIKMIIAISQIKSLGLTYWTNYENRIKLYLFVNIFSQSNPGAQ